MVVGEAITSAVQGKGRGKGTTLVVDTTHRKVIDHR